MHRAQRQKREESDIAQKKPVRHLALMQAYSLPEINARNKRREKERKKREKEEREERKRREKEERKR